jgi:hypothetical protein
MVVTVGTKGCEVKLRHGSKGLGGLTEGNGDVEIKGQTCQSLPQLNGGVQ